MLTKTEFEEQLIEAVRDRDCLYIKTHPDYKNSRERDSKWREIAEILNKSTPECLKLWTKLRQQYTAFLKRLKNPSGSGAGRRPFFRHENGMGFIKDIVDPQERTISNLEEDELITIEDKNVVNEETSQRENSPNSDDNDDHETSSPPKTVPRSNAQPDGRSHQKFGKRKMDLFDKEMLGLLKSEDDEFDSFCKMLAPKLRKVAEISRAEYLKLQHAINNLVFESELSLE